VNVEGFESNSSTAYKEYDPNNPNNTLILAQQNAGNIQYLKERLSDYDNIKQELLDLSGNYATLQKQVEDIAQAQADYATQLTGGSAPVISGTEEEDEDEDKDIDGNK